MTRWYVDTSAALKLLQDERESQALTEALESEQPYLVGCWLLETELRRAIHRSTLLTQRHATGLLQRIDLYEMPSSLFRDAGLMTGRHLRALDALHLAASSRIGVDAVLTYDIRMTESAQAMGLPVRSPEPDR